MWLRRQYRPLTCTVCIVAAVLTAALIRGPVRADGPILDRLIQVRSLILPVDELPEQVPVAVIALDRQSLQAPELRDYPRVFFAPVWATVLDGVMTTGALAVGFDLLFAYSANRFLPDYDRPFLAALGRYHERVVLARSAETLPAAPFLAALRHEEGTLGLAQLLADTDGRYRRVQSRHETLRDEYLPGLAAALLQRAKAPPMPSEVLLTPQRHVEHIPTYAVIDVFLCAKHAPDALQQAFAGKIVLVGSTLPEEDRWVSSSRFLPAPRSDAPPLHPCGLRRLGASNPDTTSVPGVFLHAAAVASVLSGQMTAIVPSSVLVAVTGAMAGVGSALGLLLVPWLTLGAIVMTALGLLGLATYLLASDVWLPLGLPFGALVGSPVVAYVIRYLAEERTRRQIERAFGIYLSPMLVEHLVNDPAALKLGGERREVTVMFADLSGFTALSGRLHPEVLMRTTNQYLAYIVEHVERTGGYVDKFIGDAVMALWGAPGADPQHAVNGIRAAMAAAARIEQARQEAPAWGEHTFSVKIGLNSGLAVIGNVGTERRYNYTAVGETVNIAARLESVPPLYACHIVIGPRTAELANAVFLLRQLDSIQVKGREAPLAIFEPLAERDRVSREQDQQVQRYAEALAHYRAGQFALAAEIWEVLAHEEQGASASADHLGMPPVNPPARMAERARMLEETPPPLPWDGVWVLGNK